MPAHSLIDREKYDSNYKGVQNIKQVSKQKIAVPYV